MNLPDYNLAVVNTTRQDRRHLRLTSRIVALDGRLLEKQTVSVDSSANSTRTLPPLGLAAALEAQDVVLVVLTLDQPDGRRLSENIYWQGRDDRSLRKLDSLAPQRVSVKAQSVMQGTETIIRVELEDQGTIPALAAKLTAVDSNGRRVLPVLYSDNYITLLPHEPRKLDIHCPASSNPCSQLEIRGWNVEPATVSVTAGSRARAVD
jgi:hypothetical protein